MYTPTTEAGTLFIPTTQFLPFKDAFLACSTTDKIFYKILQVLSHQQIYSVLQPLQPWIYHVQTHLEPSQIILASLLKHKNLNDHFFVQGLLHPHTNLHTCKQVDHFYQQILPMPKKMGMADLHPKPLISTFYLHSTSATTSKERWTYVKQQQDLPYPSAVHLSHITQDCRRSKPCSSRSLKCRLHLRIVPLSLFIPPFITFQQPEQVTLRP